MIRMEEEVDSMKTAHILSESTPETGVTFRLFLQRIPIPPQPLERWHSGVRRLSAMAKPDICG